MPTKKQRRRQQKSRRHEYEYVYVDDEGNEVDVDPDELSAERPEKVARPTKSGRPARTSSGRPARTIQPPSWRRVGKRALFVGPALVVAMMLLNRNMPPGQRIMPAFVMLAFFLPFSYLTDSFAYRMYRKRLERGATSAPKPKGR